MILGIHGLLYSSDPEATRAFFREKVKLPGSDVGAGWWIFDFAEGDLGVHPIEQPGEAGRHDVSLYCRDIHGTVAALRARGVEFTQSVADHGYGWVTYFRAPGGITVQLYEPKYVKGSAKAKPPVKRIAKRANAKPARRPAAKPGRPKKRR